jgi:hypothetical protein
MPLEIIGGRVVGAAVASASVRSVIRRGLVYGLAGVLTTYDKAVAVAREVGSTVRQEVAAVRKGGAAPVEPPPPPNPLPDNLAPAQAVGNGLSATSPPAPTAKP